MLSQGLACLAIEENPATITLLGLELPWQAALVVFLMTFLLVVEAKFDISAWLMPRLTNDDENRVKALDRLALYLAIPLLVIFLVFRERPRDYGFALGNWQLGLIVTLAAWAVMAVIGVLRGVRWGGGVGQSLREMVIIAGLSTFTLEFFFRGFLMFALYRAVGPLAIVLQMVPHTLSHLGKGTAEVFVTIVGGTLFGLLVWWTCSFYYVFLIHWFLLGDFILGQAARQGDHSKGEASYVGKAD